MGQIIVGEKIALQEKVTYTIVSAVYPMQPETGRGLFKVKSSRDGLYYALKVFDRALNAVPDIEREMVMLNNQNQHPHLFPRFRGAFQADGMACSVMDWMEGSGFDQVTADRAAGTLQDIRFRVRMLMSLCDSVDLLHRSRYWHRDLKPQNVLLRDPKDPGRGVVVIDFGMVAARRGKKEEGTRGYNAPEQVDRRNMSLGAHTDIYALGQIGWYLLAGEPLYRDCNDDSNDWSSAFIPLQERLGEESALPEGLQEVLLKAMSFDPKKRHRLVRELKSELMRYSR